MTNRILGIFWFSYILCVKLQNFFDIWDEKAWQNLLWFSLHKTKTKRWQILICGSPLCQGMKEQLQSRSIMRHCTSPLKEWEKGENKNNVKHRHRKWAVLDMRVHGWMSNYPRALPADNELYGPAWSCVQYLMCVAGRLSYCRERKSSLWRSWCFCFSVSSVSVGLSFSSSNSSAKANMQENYFK